MSALQLFSPPLSPPYPFALANDDPALALDGDDWAWRFLRLNPEYQNDFSLQKCLPPLLHNKGEWPLSRLQKDLSPANWDALCQLSAAYFCTEGFVLGRPFDWDEAPIGTLQQVLNTEADDARKLEQIFVRDFVLDCGRTWGLTDWLDPSLPSLPPLTETNRVSWFYSLYEPIYELAVFDVSRTDRSEAQPHIQATGVQAINSNNWTEYRRISVVEQGEIVQRLATIKGEAPSLREPFRSGHEVGTLICLDNNVRTQLRAVKQLLDSVAKARKLPRNYGNSSDFEPLVLDAQHPHARPFSELQTALRDLLAPSGVVRRRQWRIVVWDLQHDLGKQLRQAQLVLEAKQVELRDQDRLTIPSRIRTGAKYDAKEIFWLKAALCCMEASALLHERYPDTTFGYPRLTDAFFNPKSPWFSQVRGGPSMPATHYEPETSGKFTTACRDSLENGRDLSRLNYSILVGQKAADILPANAVEAPSRVTEQSAMAWMVRQSAPAKKSKSKKP